jgi:hypothetical protein
LRVVNGLGVFTVTNAMAWDVESFAHCVEMKTD